MTTAAWIIAAALAASALALIGWGLIGDRARGRRRRPRCFYPVPGGSRLCTECGHEARSERRLLRTRRRWRAVGLGAAFLLLATAAAGAGLVRQHGAWGWAPDTLLTRLLWTGNQHIDDEVRARIRAGRFTRAEATEGRARGAGADSREAAIALRSLPLPVCCAWLPQGNRIILGRLG